MAILNGYTKEQILNLFLDNTLGDITPADMRIFVNAIFDDKEPAIQKIADLNNFDFGKSRRNDIVIVNEPGDPHNKNGIYVITKDKPALKDIELISPDKNIIDYLTSGGDDQVLSIKDGKLKWVAQDPYEILGTKTIKEILNIKTAKQGDIWIAEDTNTHIIPKGKSGDGFYYKNGKWTNIGQLRGPTGEDSNIPGPKGDKGDQG